MSYLVHPIPDYKIIAMDLLDHDRFMPDLDLSGLAQTAKKYLEACDLKISELMEHGFSALDLHKLRSHMIDHLVVSVFEKSVRGSRFEDDDNFALLACGGYGREEMSVSSDVDLLLVYKSGNGKACEELMQKLLYVLWDLKLDVGHAIRKLANCKALMREEHTVFTSILDARFLSGNSKIHDELIQIRDSLLNTKKTREKFIKDKLEERDARLKKYGSSVYLLEPNLKEGEGSLRDLHFMRWLGRAFGVADGFAGLEKEGFIDAEMAKFLSFAFEFLLRLRNQLHFLHRKKNDQMNFIYQESLAKEMNFHDDKGGILGVEKFMQTYYAVAAQVNQITNAFVQKIFSRRQGRLLTFIHHLKSKKIDENFKLVDDKIVAIRSDIFRNHPAILMEIFEHVQKTGKDIHFATKNLIRENLFLVDDVFRSSDQVRSLFKAMMSHFENLGKTLFLMHQVHFFDRLIPEFLKLRNRMQHDLYHVYTVDTHSIFAIEELSKLVSDPEYAKKFSLYREAVLFVKRPDLLSFGLLFHDIGKGEGGNHSVVGAELANKIMARLGYSKEDQETVEFLVLSHLLMSHLSQRRDIDDPQLISEFAASMKTLDRMNMLFVLTWADIRAVSAEAWTEWKDGLLSKLYNKTKEELAINVPTQEKVRLRVADVRKAILGRLQSKIEAKKLETFLQSISPRYVLSHSDDEIDEHFHMIMNHDDSHILFLEKELSRGAISELLIYTLNSSRLLPWVAAVMPVLEINILDMEVFVLTDGHALLKMRVQTGLQESLRKADLVESLRRKLDDIFLGKIFVEDLLAKRHQPSFMRKMPVQKAKTIVAIDNDVSAYYTVIDIFAHDRLGLLHDIVKCLANNGCYVEVSKISTKVEQVVDSFYVKDIFGHKITSTQKLNEIKRALIQVVVDLKG